MTAMHGSAPVAAAQAQPSRLRQSLRLPTAPILPAAATTGRIECRWAGGSIDPRFQFRAILDRPRGLRRIIAVSPVFVCGKRPVRPTPEAEAALAALCAALDEAGWHMLPVAAGRDWYAHDIESAA